jgi:hypothetical protein
LRGRTRDGKTGAPLRRQARQGDYYRANPNGVGEAYFYQASPSDDVFAVVAFTSDNIPQPPLKDGDSILWYAIVTNSVPPPTTCEPPQNDLFFNPTGVSDPRVFNICVL